MAELRIYSIVAIGDCSSGNAEVMVADQRFQINLTVEELARLKQVGLDAFERQRQSLADNITNAQPALLMAPTSPEPDYAEFAELPAEYVPNDADDLPL